MTHEADWEVIDTESRAALIIACEETVRAMKHLRTELQIGPDGEGLDFLHTIDAVIEDNEAAISKAEGRDQ